MKAEQLINVDLSNPAKQYSIGDMREIAIEVLGEYLHGTAELEDVANDLTAKQYGEVVNDLLLCLDNWTE